MNAPYAPDPFREENEDIACAHIPDPVEMYQQFVSEESGTDDAAKGNETFSWDGYCPFTED